jgi:hypothetical protein
VLKGALALNFRLAIATRTTKDIDLGHDDDEQSAIHDITTAQQLALDDHFTFAATRTYELEDTDEFSAVRFPGGHRRARLHPEPRRGRHRRLRASRAVRRALRDALRRD